MIDIIDLSKIKCTKFLEGDFVDFKPGKIQPATDDIDALLDAICYYIFGKFQIAKIIPFKHMKECLPWSSVVEEINTKINQSWSF